METKIETKTINKDRTASARTRDRDEDRASLENYVVITTASLRRLFFCFLAKAQIPPHKICALAIAVGAAFRHSPVA